MPFDFEQTKLEDALIVRPEVFQDERGFLMETYLKEDFAEVGVDQEFIQDKYSRSQENVLRGLHFQAPGFAQGKIVRCTRGKVFDVIVDLRRSSSTFGRTDSLVLSEENKKALYVPKGFAHGFLVLSELADVHYKIDDDYAPEKERGIRWDDPDLGIDWPVKDPLVSERDEKLPSFRQLKESDVLFG